MSLRMQLLNRKKRSSSTIAYTTLKHHRNWFNNVHTRDMKNYFTSYEIFKLRDVFKITMDCAKTAKTPLIKDRLKTMAVTTIRCFMRRGLIVKDREPNVLQISVDELGEMIREAKEILSEHYFGEENDFYWEELLKLEKLLEKRK